MIMQRFYTSPFFKVIMAIWMPVLLTIAAVRVS